QGVGGRPEPSGAGGFKAPRAERGLTADVKTSQSSFFDKARQRYTGVLRGLLRLRFPLLAGYFAVAAGATTWWLLGHPGAGMEIFPTVDAGQFQIRLRAPTGTRIQK